MVHNLKFDMFPYYHKMLTENIWFLVMICAILYILDAATSSGILKGKQKLGRTFNSDKLGGIAFTKISKLTMCSA